MQRVVRGTARLQPCNGARETEAGATSERVEGDFVSLITPFPPLPKVEAS